MKKKVFVGLSGGVDSAVAAYLLLDQGFDVTAVFMKNWSGEEFGVEDQCPWEEDLASAREVANFLNIPLLVYNFEKEYRKAVISDFFYQYSIGNTPNPDILCNKFIKFKSFLDRAISEGADYIATGHYTKKVDDSLYRGKDKNKDQTYFLSQLDHSQISKSLFPLGELEKKEVREIAKKIKLPNANRKDSQGICFLGKIDVVDFLKNELKEKKGEIIDIDSNKVIGEHTGVWFYTIGQRSGLNIGGSDLPYFICKKDVENNIIYVAKGKDNPLLYSNSFTLNECNILEEFEKEMFVQIRHRGDLVEVDKIEINNGIIALTLKNSIWAPAIGQSAVMYSKDEKLISSGIIFKV